MYFSYPENTKNNDKKKYLQTIIKYLKKYPANYRGTKYSLYHVRF